MPSIARGKLNKLRRKMKKILWEPIGKFVSKIRGKIVL